MVCCLHYLSHSSPAIGISPSYYQFVIFCMEHAPDINFHVFHSSPSVEIQMFALLYNSPSYDLVAPSILAYVSALYISFEGRTKKQMGPRGF